MKTVLIVAGALALLADTAAAQGVAQTPQSAPVNQQRQNGYTVSPNSSRFSSQVPSVR